MLSLSAENHESEDVFCSDRDSDDPGETTPQSHTNEGEEANGDDSDFKREVSCFTGMIGWVSSAVSLFLSGLVLYKSKSSLCFV